MAEIQSIPLLSLLVALPLLGALMLALFVRGTADTEAKIQRQASNARAVALLVTLATFIFSLLLLFKFDPSTSAFQLQETVRWFEDANIHYRMGVDGISLFFILLTTLLLPICVLVSWRSINTQVREYMIAFLLLESLVIGVFAALDFVIFYVFFEASLIPMFLIIGIWGGENRVYAAFKFFLYTLAGSLLLLLALLFVHVQLGTTDIPELMQRMPELSLSVQKWLWLAFFASFAVKVPMWPVHTWLPDAHVQAPTAGSVILAGILLKLGAYGFIRFSLPMLPDATLYFTPLMYTLSIIALIYTSLVALMQKDMKKLIAYSSVAHMGYVTIGLFALNAQAVEGAIFQMISHGLVSAALFICVGVLYDRMHTKEISKYGGVVHSMPKFAFFFVMFTMASVGLPTTSGFVGEFLVILGAYQSNTIVAAFTATGVVLGAAYMLWLVKRVIFGQALNKKIEALKDVTALEYTALMVLLLLTIILGIYPSLITDYLNASVHNLLDQVQ